MKRTGVIDRIYGGSLGVAVQIKTGAVALLRDEALEVWRGIDTPGVTPPSPRRQAILAHFQRLGLIDAPLPQGVGDGLLEEAPPVDRVDFGVINYWAFKNRIPISGHLELTGRCNIRCRHCYCLFDRSQDALSTGQVFHILDDLRESGTLGLVLTGGEFFVRPDSLEILRKLHENRFIVRINTNGSLIDEKLVREMAELDNIYRIHVSLYGSRPEIHDRVTRAPGSFEKTVAALQMLKEAGFNLRINCCLMQSNVEDYPNVQREIADKLEIPVRFDPVIFPKDDGSTVNLADNLTDAQLAAFDRFREENRKAAGDPPDGEAKPKLCKAGFSFFSMAEDGSLYPCLKMKRYYSHPMGNLARQSFGDIWNRSKAARSIREPLQDKLRNCSICDLSL